MMHKRSVGLISLSILLIFTGVFIFMYTILDRNFELYFYFIAPASLIILGLEILYASFSLKDGENMRISGLSVAVCLGFAAFSLFFFNR